MKQAAERVEKAPFITFEGGEGAGKSTQIKRLAARLQGAGVDVVMTREPGGSPKAEQIRALLLAGAAKRFGTLAEAVLFSAARIDHIDTLIAPALRRGTWVLCDRFVDSTRVYQGASGGIDPRQIAALERVVAGDVMPDLTVILDLPAEAGLARAAARTGTAGASDRFEAEGLGFHEKLREAFLSIAAAEPGRCVVIDATKDKDDVEEAIWTAVVERLPIPAAARAKMQPSKRTKRGPRVPS
ncbi:MULTISPECIES: dTMP kinase [unclassified Chelatococcus]|uniref:dTMP kinase n=1 Tax=unclassified Chelatococcus TaxID=2638111 RepID=UPI001BCB4F86|nr:MULTISPECIES: dTMP kinase [unclassified Chelatococcus]MBS7699251.1 dTMP kinase [Chelatococcus sp. YT9]MBX3557617.1 dTMP kinase [Chelatococcus sp.]